MKTKLLCILLLILAIVSTVIAATDDTEDLIDAASLGDINRVRILLAIGADVNTKRSNGVTALWMATAKGHTEIVKALLESKADVNAEATGGMTALFVAATRGYTEIVKALLKNKADVNAKTTNGMTALLSAALDGHTEIVKALLESKADVNAEETGGMTALWIAAQDGNTEIVKALLENGADANTMDTDGVTALWMAASMGHLPIVKALLESKADVNAEALGGFTALFTAASKGHLPIVKVLLENGAEVNAKIKNGVTVLHMASLKGHTDVAKALLEKGVDLTVELHGETALELARRKGHQKIVTLLQAASDSLEGANDFFNQGLKASNSDDMPTAIQNWSKALKLFQQIKGTERQQAKCYQNIGVALDDVGKYEEAIAKQEQALAIYKTIKGTERNQAGCYINIGVVLGNMGKHEEDIAKQEQALAIYKQIKGTELDQADCYKNIGVSLEDMGKYEEAIAKQEQALVIYKKIKDTEKDQAACYKNIGVALHDMSKYEEAIAKQEQALAIYKQIMGTERNQAGCHMNIGVAFGEMGKYEEMIAKQEEALSIYKKIKGTEREQADCYKNIGVAFGEMGKYEEKIAKQEQALSIYKTINGTELDQAGCYVNIGVALNSMGKYEENIARQEQALELFQQTKGTEREQAGCYVNIGVALHDMHKYEEDIVRQEQALKILKTIKGTDQDQATCYRNIGVALRNMAKYEEAIARQEQALKLYQQVKGTERDQSSCYGNIGMGHLGMGRYSKAIISFGRAGRGWWISQGLGQAYHLRSNPGDDQKAVQSLLNAIESAERKRNSVLGFEHRAGIFEEPAQVYPDFVSLLVDISEKKAKIEQPKVLGWSVDSGSDTVLLESAFHFADRGKGRAMEDALREKVTLKATRPDTNLLSKDKELSLQISKLTSLRDGLSEAEIGRRGRLTHQINDLQQQRNMLEVELKRTVLGSYVLPEFRMPMEMAKELPTQTAVLQYSVGEKESWLLILTREGVTAHRLGAETSALPKLLPRQEATLGQLTQAWKERTEKIGLDGLVRLARMRAEDLSRKPRERHNLIDANQERAILERLGEVALPSLALAELRKKEIRHLLVIPDGSLHYVPFAMLRVEGDSKASKQYLVEQYSISYTPAMTTLETVRKQAQERQRKRKLQRRSLLAFANPSFTEAVVPSPDDMVTRVRSFRSGYYRDSGLRLTVLPETEQEAMRVASLFGPPERYTKSKAEAPTGGAVVYTSQAASEDVVKRLLAPSKEKRQWQYLLFSTHGLADVRNGMLSCIALSSPSSDSPEDGFLQAQEIMGLELDCELVMLSACQTGLGRLRSGEGFVGLNGAFFYAGAESVCASLWQVPTGPTSQLSTEFFRNFKERKLDKAEALRQAQLAVMQSSQGSPDGSIQYSDPFCWAAFVLTGEWK